MGKDLETKEDKQGVVKYHKWILAFKLSFAVLVKLGLKQRRFEWRKETRSAM